MEAGGAHGHAFVQGHVVRQLGIVDKAIEQWIFGGAGITENAIHPVELQRLHENLTASHPVPLPTEESGL